VRRQKHGLSHYVLSTFDMGQLIPVCNYEVLPGDSIRMATSCLIRVSPLMTPVMHPVSVRIHHWFVPYRILWDGWEDFITGGSDGEGDGVGNIPSFVPDQTLGELADYLGIPTTPALNTQVTKFPFFAYAKIYNEYYRDQDLAAALSEDITGTPEQTPVNVAWEKDYFTSARPWTQKGPDVTVPVNGIVTTAATDLLTGAQNPVRLLRTTGAELGQQQFLGVGNAAGDANQRLGTATAPAGSNFNQEEAYFSNLQVQNAEASINDFRLAFALQRYQEARAQFGSRYTEYLRYLGVRSSDARLQRPEYLGGGRATISFSEVLKTGEGDTPSDEAPIGEMRGHGISALRSRRWIRFFEEHGVVMTLCSIRPRTMYVTAMHRGWARRTKEDYWQKELEQIGQQEVFNSELFAGSATPAATFGYQDRYADYRHMFSYVTGEYRTILNDWHLARDFTAQPTLNQDFIDCVPSKRIHAEQTQNSIWGMFSHSIQARRMVGNRTIGRLF